VRENKRLREKRSPGESVTVKIPPLHSGRHGAHALPQKPALRLSKGVKRNHASSSPGRERTEVRGVPLRERHDANALSIENVRRAEQAPPAPVFREPQHGSDAKELRIHQSHPDNTTTALRLSKGP